MSPLFWLYIYNIVYRVLLRTHRKTQFPYVRTPYYLAYNADFE